MAGVTGLIVQFERTDGDAFFGRYLYVGRKFERVMPFVS